VPHFLDDDLRAKRLEGARQILDVLEAQQRCHFRDLVTGDDDMVYLNMKRGTIRFLADAKLPVCVKRTIVSENGMLIFFWGIHGIAHDCLLRKYNILDLLFFREEALILPA
jgi:hypothetical protein